MGAGGDEKEMGYRLGSVTLPLHYVQDVYGNITRQTLSALVTVSLHYNTSMNQVKLEDGRFTARNRKGMASRLVIITVKKATNMLVAGLKFQFRMPFCIATAGN